MPVSARACGVTARGLAWRSRSPSAAGSSAQSASCRRVEERLWPEETVSRLHLVAQMFSNVLARKYAELELRASEARFRTVADDAPVMIWASGTDKACRWFNRRWLDFAGRTLEQALGSGWTDSVHPDDLSACLQAYTSAFEERRSFSMEFRLRRHDGEWRWVLGRGMPTVRRRRRVQAAISVPAST